MNDRWRIGDVTVVAVVEQHTETPVEFLPTASEDTLARHRDWLSPWALGDEGRLRFVIQALCVEADGRKIVVDTGVGTRRLPEAYAWMTTDESFLTALDAAGFGRDDVDVVVCTHLHFDHVGWNTSQDNGADGGWVPTFRQARYLLVRDEYEHWRAASDEVKANSSVFNFEDAVTPLLDAGVVDLVEPDHAVTGSVRLVPTPGHSPGHVSLRIDSAGERAIITGDCAHHPVQLAEPRWHTVGDLDPERASATREHFVAEYADTPVLIIGTHFPPPTAGHLVSSEDGVRFRPSREW